MSRGRPVRVIRKAPPTVLVISQDTGGVYTYLRQRLQRNASLGGIAVRVVGMGVSSKTMLAAAKTALAGGNDSVPAANFVALVFDRDNDPHFENVLESVRSHPKISAFISVPCFEYFFIVHFGISRADFSGPNEVISSLKQLEGFSSYAKAKSAVPIVRLKAMEEKAIQNARSVRNACVADGSYVPWTNIDELFEFVDEAIKNGIEKAEEKIVISQWKT